MLPQLTLVEIILYVSNQEKSTAFFQKLLRKPPKLNVPGMTEFELTATCKLGLMPNNGIAKILGTNLPHPDTGMGIPRCELYLMVKDIELELANALTSGAQLVSPIQARNWGHITCYLSDPDGHIIAFATPTLE